jgi:hypothetical protein
MILPLLFGAALIAAAYAGSKAIAKENSAVKAFALSPVPPLPPPAPNGPSAVRPGGPRPTSRTPGGIARTANASPKADEAARMAAGAGKQVKKAVSKAAQQLASIAKRASVGQASVPECVAGLAWHSKRPDFSSDTSPFFKGLSKQVGEVKADQILSRIRARNSLKRAG